MPLEDLLETIEALRGRIGEHGQSLRKSETLTRYALIDPLLRELGWDTSNPDQVVPEYPSSGGRADYALLAEGTPRMMVEAKKLGEQMRGAVSQGINYCLEKGTLYFAVTDGQSWEIYETHKPVPVEQKRIVEFDLLKDAPSDVCLKALSLWRPSVEQGHVRLGETPLTIKASLPEAKPSESPSNSQRSVAEVKAGGNWTLLTELQLEPFAKPADIQFPSGEIVSVNTWTSFVTRLVQWLVDVGTLSEQGPLQVGKRYLVAPSPTHPDGKPFRQAYRAGPLHVETHYSGSDTVRNARRVIEHAGMDPADFKVRLAD